MGLHDIKLLQGLGNYLGGQALGVTPLLFIACIFTVVSLWRQAKTGDEAARFLFSFSIPVFIFFLVSAFRSSVETRQ